MRFASLLLACLSLIPAAAAAEEVYAGKIVTLIIGSGEGAGYDLSGRLVAQHLRRFIPGAPTVLPRNMPGASSLRAAEYLFNVAPRDGTALGWFQPTIVTSKLTDPTIRLAPERFGWIGRLSSMVTVGIVRADAPAQSVEQAKRAKLFIGANGPTGNAATVPWALDRMIGTRFELVTGYESGNQEGLALERGEIQGIGSVSWEFLESKPDWLTDGKIRFLYTIGLARDRRAPDAPSLPELAPDARDRQAMVLIASVSDIGRALVTTPDAPPERLALLRQAFAAMLSDPQFREDAARKKVGWSRSMRRRSRRSSPRMSPCRPRWSSA
jgi:tripartite-type tricarboxylate transporter receptor subunit TctC